MSKYVRGRWTKEEIDFLRAAHPHQSCGQIGHFLDRSRSAVAGMAYRLGLSKT